MPLQLQGHPNDCPWWPFEVGENESTAGANVPHDMPGSTRPVQIIRRKVCNPLARCVPPFWLACQPILQPRHPSEPLPPGELENPVHRQGLGLHKLLAGGPASAKDSTTAVRRWEGCSG